MRIRGLSPHSHEIETPRGVARLHVHPVAEPRGVLVLGHGAGGGVSAPDLKAATTAAHEAGFSVVLGEQPYRVAGRRSAAPAAQLDEAWLAMVEHVRGHAGGDLPLVTGGRSSGARVACRTAEPCGAAAVLCLAFPLHPPGRPEKTRLPELRAVQVPVLIVQGEADPFGMPPRGKGRKLVKLAGDHGLKKDLPGLRSAVRTWLAALATER